LLLSADSGEEFPIAINSAMPAATANVKYLLILRCLIVKRTVLPPVAIRGAAYMPHPLL
jgi:hypothetical protein